MQEAWVRSMGWEDPLEKETAIHSSILAWRIPRTEKGVTESWAQLNESTTTTKILLQFVSKVVFRHVITLPDVGGIW